MYSYILIDSIVYNSRYKGNHHMCVCMCIVSVCTNMIIFMRPFIGNPLFITNLMCHAKKDILYGHHHAQHTNTSGRMQRSQSKKAETLQIEKSIFIFRIMIF